ncbi:hypothetical protein Trydic_g2350 [Trypoxylus dichotomus]
MKVAGLVLATQDDDVQKLYEGHDQNKIYQPMNHGVGISDELRQRCHGLEDRHHDTRQNQPPSTRPPSLIDILGNIKHTGTNIYPSVPALVDLPLIHRSKANDYAVVADDSHNVEGVMNLEDSITPQFHGRLCIVQRVRMIQYDMLSGVPRESSLGPLLFILYMDDLIITLSCPALAYTDDLTIYSVVTGVNNYNLLQRDVDVVVDWCQRN